MVSEAIEAVGDAGDDCLCLREFQPAFLHALLHAGFALTFQPLFRGAGDDAVVGIPDHVHLAAIGCLAGWLGELLLEPAFKTIQCEVGQDWGGYTSYKVANMLVEFATSMPRTQLRPSYGDGFLGAPLQTRQALEHPAPREQGGRRGTSNTHPHHNPGGAPLI